MAESPQDAKPKPDEPFEVLVEAQHDICRSERARIAFLAEQALIGRVDPALERLIQGWRERLAKLEEIEALLQALIPRQTTVRALCAIGRA